MNRSMLLSSLAAGLAALLGGCVSGSPYRQGVGDYYYGQPSAGYRDYGYGSYGGYGYPGSGYGYGGFGGYGYGYGSPYGYSGYPYVDGGHRQRRPNDGQAPQGNQGPRPPWRDLGGGGLRPPRLTRPPLPFSPSMQPGGGTVFPRLGPGAGGGMRAPMRMGQERDGRRGSKP